MSGPVVWYRLPKITDAQKQIGLIGRWKQTIEGYVQFDKDGSAILGGAKYLYTVIEKQVIIKYQSGSDFVRFITVLFVFSI